MQPVEGSAKEDDDGKSKLRKPPVTESKAFFEVSKTELSSMVVLGI